MLKAIRDNIKSFLAAKVVITMIAVGIFTIFADYRYFKKMKFKKDAAVSLGLGLACILLPIILFIISKL